MQRKLYLEVMLDSGEEEGDELVKMIKQVEKSPTSFTLSRLIFTYGRKVMKLRATTPQTGKWSKKVVGK